MEEEKKLPLVILVDDEEAICDMFKQRFRKWYDIRAFQSGEQMLRELDQLRPSLFVVDWIMPEMDGITLCREIRKRHQFDPVPIAFYTGIDPKIENMEMAFEAGAQSFIQKTLPTSFTLAHLNTLLNNYKRLMYYMRHREIMLSVLKHEMVNLATGLTTGVEILSMHPMMQDDELKFQVDSILDSSKSLRALFGDLNEVLIIDKQDDKRAMLPICLEDVHEDLQEYLVTVGREVSVNFPPDTEIVCDRQGLGRALYYMVRFADAYMPPDTGITITAVPEEQGTTFIVTLQGDYLYRLQTAIERVGELHQVASRNDLMCLQYIENVLYCHNTTFSVNCENEQTRLQFLLPRRGTISAD